MALPFVPLYFGLPASPCSLLSVLIHHFCFNGRGFGVGVRTARTLAVAPVLTDARPPSRQPFPAGHLLSFKVESPSARNVGSPGPRPGWASRDMAHREADSGLTHRTAGACWRLSHGAAPGGQGVRGAVRGRGCGLASARDGALGAVRSPPRSRRECRLVAGSLCGLAQGRATVRVSGPAASGDFGSVACLADSPCETWFLPLGDPRSGSGSWERAGFIQTRGPCSEKRE